MQQKKRDIDNESFSLATTIYGGHTSIECPNVVLSSEAL